MNLLLLIAPELRLAPLHALHDTSILVINHAIGILCLSLYTPGMSFAPGEIFMKVKGHHVNL